MPARTRTQNPPIPEISVALKPYLDAHPNAKLDSYAQNSVSIRIRVIDPDFRDVNRADRYDLIWDFLEEKLPEHLIQQITVLLLLTPDEVETSFANMDFEDPIPSRL